MPHSIGLLHVNIPYGMPQLQHYSSGQQISNHTSLVTLCSNYVAFFYSDLTQQMLNLPEETLLICFVTTLNNAFETELIQEDEGCVSESLNIPTSLSRAPRVCHVSTIEDLSFDPANYGQSPTSPEQHEEHLP